MALFWRSVVSAVRLLLSGSPELWETIGLSLGVSGTAVLLASLVGIPSGSMLAFAPDRWMWRAVSSAINSLMALPPVLVGLVVYMSLSARGPLGQMELLFTPAAMVMAQTILTLPIITGLSHSAVSSVPGGIRDAARSLGASPPAQLIAVVREARAGLAVAIAAGLGRALAEVGAVMLVGGNIAGHTRVMTTAIMLETRRGKFSTAMGLGLILLTLSLSLNAALGLVGSAHRLRRYE